MTGYTHPEGLVSTEWVANHLADPNVRIVEVDIDTKAYSEGHVPGAIGWAWNTQLCDTVRRDILSKSQMEQLLSSSGVSPNTTLIIYGDSNNWFAAWALWQAKPYGHRDVRLMNGGRKKWLSEGRDLSTDTPRPPHTHYRAGDADLIVEGLPGSSSRGFCQWIGGIGGCAQSGRIHGRDSGPTRAARNVSTWRPCTQSAQCALGKGV